MTKVENKIYDFFKENKNIIFFVVVTVLALFVRIAGFDFISQDMKGYLVVWFDRVKKYGSLKSLGIRVGEYNVIYQFLIALMTYIKMNSVHLYKILSLIFDYLLAFYTALFICEIRGKKCFSTIFNIAYAIVLFLPTVFLNSSFWGQCDAIYSSFLVIFLYYLYKEKYTKAFIFFGCALAFKLQAVFILPFVIAYYFYKKRFSILNLLISFGVFYGLNSIGLFFGRNFFEPIKVYTDQVGIYKKMWLNFPSFWQLVGKDHEWLSKASIFVTMAVLGVLLLIVMSGYKKIEDAESFISVSALFLWTALLFLPAMHERYSFFLDIVLIILAFTNVKYLKFTIVNVVMNFLTYGKYLFKMPEITQWHVIIYFVFYCWFAYEVLKEEKENVGYFKNN